MANAGYKSVGISCIDEIPIRNADSLDASDSIEMLGTGEALASVQYTGHGGFSFAPISSFAAKKAGFFSSARLPDLGTRVVSFRRDHWQRQGVVVEIDEEILSDGTDGLRIGIKGARITVEDDEGQTFQTWSVFLAPANDMEYSSVCTTDEFRNSAFQQLYFHNAGSDFACTRVSDVDARASLIEWLDNVEDSDGERVAVPDEVKQELLNLFDAQADPSIHLYSRHTKFGPKQSLKRGEDYSIYFLAMNNTLNHDQQSSIQRAFPLIQHMICRLLYTGAGNERSLHRGGRVWKGDCEPPVPMNMKKLKAARKDRSVVRFRQFQSTSSNEAVANRFKKREDTRGYLWIIDIPSDYWGARDIQSMAWKSNESETLFPPYSAFLVDSVDDECCHLTAVDKFYDCGDLSGVKCNLEDLGTTLT